MKAIWLNTVRLSIRQMERTEKIQTHVSMPFRLRALSLLPHHAEDQARPADMQPELLPSYRTEFARQSRRPRRERKLPGNGKQCMAFLRESQTVSSCSLDLQLDRLIAHWQVSQRDCSSGAAWNIVNLHRACVNGPMLALEPVNERVHG